MRGSALMKRCLHDTVNRLLELLALEERLATLGKGHGDFNTLKALISTKRSNLPVPVLFDHDRLRAHGKRSVAEVRHGVCSGCHLELAIGNVHELKTGSLRRCGNCGRYLYLAEEEDEPAPTSVSAGPRRHPRGKSTATGKSR